ncbi:MAG: hypothetical protein JJLCMIEE_00845 [Acidimicrobiales bacterium]|nr:hypothetical protein [Acidimicrobiales bacterium]
MTAAIKTNMAGRAAALVGLILVALVVARVALAGIEIAGVLAIALIVGVGVYIARDWNLLLYAMVLSLFLEGVGVGPASVGRVLSVTAFLAIVARFLLAGWRPLVPRASGWIPMLLLTTWAWASGLWAADSAAWVSGLGHLAVAVAYFAAFALFVTRAEQVRPLLYTYLAAALAVTPIALLEYSIGIRAVGLQGDPNQFSLYQAAAIPIIVQLSRRGASPKNRLWLGALVPLMLSIVVSGSRTGLLTAFILLVLLLVPWRAFRARRGRSRLIPLAVLIAVLGGVVCVYVIGTRADTRLDIQSLIDDRGSHRLELWYVGWTVYVDHPWVGLGLENFESQSARLLETTVGSKVDRLIEVGGVGVHNSYLEVMVNLGVIGLVLFLAVLLTAGVKLYDARRRWPSLGLQPLLPMLFAACLGAAVLPLSNKLIFMLAGMGAAFTAIERTVHAPAAPVRTASR